MEKKKQIDEIPKYSYNPDLDKYKEVLLFPEKYNHVKEILKKCPPPKDLLEGNKVD